MWSHYQIQYIIVIRLQQLVLQRMSGACGSTCKSYLPIKIKEQQFSLLFSFARRFGFGYLSGLALNYLQLTTVGIIFCLCGDFQLVTLPVGICAAGVHSTPFAAVYLEAV